MPLHLYILGDKSIICGGSYGIAEIYTYDNFCGYWCSSYVLLRHSFFSYETPKGNHSDDVITSVRTTCFLLIGFAEFVVGVAIHLW